MLQQPQQMSLCLSHQPLITTGLYKLMTPDNYSSLNQLLAVTAHVQRFIDNLQLSTEASRITPLTSTELSNAKQRWIKHCQEQAFPSEILALKTTGQTRQTNKSPCLVNNYNSFLTVPDSCGVHVEDAFTMPYK